MGYSLDVLIPAMLKFNPRIDHLTMPPPPLLGHVTSKLVTEKCCGPTSTVLAAADTLQCLLMNLEEFHVEPQVRVGRYPRYRFRAVR